MKNAECRRMKAGRMKPAMPREAPNAVILREAQDL
jgi:hypothetical protein